MKRLLVACLASVAAYLSASPAQAGGSCDAVQAMTSVTVEEREFLLAICEMPEGDADAWRRGMTEEVARLRRIAARAAETNPSDAAALLTLLPNDAIESRQYSVNCKGDVLREAIADALEGVQGKERQDHPRQRRSGEPLYSECEGPVVPDAQPGQQGEPRAPTGSGLRPWSILAPSGWEVRLAVGGPAGGLLRIEETKTTPPLHSDDSADPSDLYVPYTARLPFGVPFVAVVRPPKPTSEADAAPSVEQESPLPLVLRGVVGTESTRVGVARRAHCVDIRVASEKPLRFFLDGIELTVVRTGNEQSRTLWIPEDANVENRWEHRLTGIAEGKQGSQILIQRELVSSAADPQTCLDAHYDLTQERFDRTVGLAHVGVGECVAAGIDEHKLRSAVAGFVQRSGLQLVDITHLAEDNARVSDLGDSSDRVRRSNRRWAARSRTPWARDGIGADRGALELTELLASRGEEFRRQGFAQMLTVDLHCSQGAESGWDYSFQARRVDLAEWAVRQEDPLRGKSLDGIDRTDSEFILTRDNLATGINATLARLFGVHGVGLEPFPERISFVATLEGRAVVQLPATPSAHYAVDLAYRTLTEKEAVSTCAVVDEINELRAKPSKLAEFTEGSWQHGPLVPLPAEAGERRVQVGAQQIRPTQALVRTRLYRSNQPIAPETGGQAAMAQARQSLTVVGESLRCTDFSRKPVEVWVDLSTWIQTGIEDPSRNESSTSLSIWGGFDWSDDITWASVAFGFGLGYAHTERSGDQLPTWDGLDDPTVPFEPNGGVKYRVTEDAVLAAVHFGYLISLCELTVGQVCGRVARRALLESNLDILPGLHVVQTAGVPEGLTEFRGDTTQVLPDVGLFFGVGAGIDLGSGFRVSGRYALGTKRLGDCFRPSTAASTQAALFVEWTLGAAWEF